MTAMLTGTMLPRACVSMIAKRIRLRLAPTRLPYRWMALGSILGREGVGSSRAAD